MLELQNEELRNEPDESLADLGRHPQRDGS
jgi:hypothetical protein